MKKARITGLSSISCVGNSVEELWNACLDGRSGIQHGLGYISESTFTSLRESSKSKDLPESRSAQLAIWGAEQAMRSAGWTELRPDDGLILATTTGQIPVWDQALKKYLAGGLDKEQFLKALQHQPLGALLKTVSKHFKFFGAQQVVSSACSASTHALMVAAMWLNQSRVRRCLVGGVEVLCDLTIEGFRSLKLLSEESCQPFDRDRKGINLAEGSAFFCLEKESDKTPLAVLSGFGLNCDGHHMTAPQPEGQGSFRAMSSALASAKLQPSDIDWVHAHGTGSEHNDLAEGFALKTLFAETTPWVSSTKGVHGHALGASGLLEAGLCIHAFQRATVLKTHGLNEPDPTIASLRYSTETVKTPLYHVLKNTLGFGGSNASLILSHAETSS